MTDNDIFRRTVSQAWRRAAREVFTSEFTERAIGLTLSAAADVLKRVGCPGLPELLAITSSFRSSIERPSSLIDVLDQVEAIEYRYFNDVTRVAGDVVRRLAAGAMAEEHGQCHLGDNDVVAEIIVELAVREVMPAPLLLHLQHTDGWSALDLEDRRDALRQALRQAPRLRKLAQQLHKDPNGGAVTRPRSPRILPDHDALLTTFALTA